MSGMIFRSFSRRCQVNKNPSGMLLFANTVRSNTLLILLIELDILLDILRFVFNVVRSVACLKHILVLILLTPFLGTCPWSVKRGSARWDGGAWSTGWVADGGGCRWKDGWVVTTYLYRWLRQGSLPMIWGKSLEIADRFVEEFQFVTGDSFMFSLVI